MQFPLPEPLSPKDLCVAISLILFALQVPVTFSKRVFQTTFLNAILMPLLITPYPPLSLKCIYF